MSQRRTLTYPSADGRHTIRAVEWLPDGTPRGVLQIVHGIAEHMGRYALDAGFQYNGLTELIVTKDMSERKAKMIALGDAFIAFPGGTGTLEEISEIISKVALNQLNAPCILYNLNGYYDDLKHLLSLMIEKGLSSAERQKGIFFAETLEEIKDILGK